MTWVNLNIIIDGFDLIKNKNKNKNGTLYTLLTAPSENRDFGPHPPPRFWWDSLLVEGICVN